MNRILKVARIGFVDGYEQPGEFSVGMTYDSSALQCLYDLASRVGQWAGRLLK